ncbi:MAG TPA: hypothetical protein VIW03_01185, partial [Anaeromyxobacter sp.]
MRYGCQQCREEASLREESSLSHLARTRLAAHLAACSSCRSYAATLESARAWTPVLSAAARESILDRVWARREPARRQQAPRWRAARVWLSAASVLVSLALVRTGMEIAKAPP